jgi:hypothetical protein
LGAEFRRKYRVIWIALLFWALAGALYTGRRAAFGDRPAAVHVRWTAGVDEAQRRQLERQYGLTAPQFTEGRTFAYALTDLSSANIRALVLDPAAEDTHEINRTAFRVGFLSPRLPYATPYPAIPSALDGLALLCLVLGAAWTTVRGGLARMAQGIADRIPAATPEAVAVFRILFGLCLLIVVFRRPVFAAWAAQPANVISPAQSALLQIFVNAPWMVDGLGWWLAIWGGLFIAGAFARAAFACLTAGVFAWALLYTTTTTYHTVSSLLLALVVLQWSRWSDAWSVDAWRRRVSVRPTGALATPKAYGYTVWVPGVVLGVVFAAAAVAKIRDSGLAWITNGTVKYHFLSDSIQAMVDWGLWIGRHHWLSVGLSFGAIAIEALVIVAVLMGTYRYRLLAGAAALCLLMGFTLLQGLFWPGWWILLLSFLPWHLIRPDKAGHLPIVKVRAAADPVATDGAAARAFSASAKAGSQSDPTNGAGWAIRFRGSPAASEGGTALDSVFPRAPVFVVMALIALQLCVSLLRIEVSPLLSTYDMYATTYGSPQEYEQKAGQAYWIVGIDGEEQVHRCRITRGEADAIAGAAATDPRDTGTMMRRCFDASLDIRTVSLEATRVQIDWTRWERLDEPIRVSLTRAILLE